MPTDVSSLRGRVPPALPPVSLDERFAELRRLRREAEVGGGEERIARQHKAGKKTARERIDLLVDKGSCAQLGRLRRQQAAARASGSQRIPGDGEVTGAGRIH